MTPQELYDQAKQGDVLLLTLSRTSRGERIRLTKTSGPLGVILNVRDGRTTARFESRAVKRYLEKRCKYLK